MSVGGKIIEMLPMRIKAGNYPGTWQDVVRIAVADGQDETCVYAEPAPVMPSLGDSVWWTSGQILFDGDRQKLRKVAYSFTPPWSRAASD